MASAVPKLAGPLAIALAGMDAEVRDAIAERAMQPGAKAAGAEGGELVFRGLGADWLEPQSQALISEAQRRGGVSCSP